jgi:hypothetical protein
MRIVYNIICFNNYEEFMSGMLWNVGRIKTGALPTP